MLLKGLISLIFRQKNGNFKQILVSNWVSVHLMEVSVSVSVSKFYSWKVSVSISVSKFYNWKVSVSYRYRISIPAWYQYRIGIEKSGIEDLCRGSRNALFARTLFMNGPMGGSANVILKRGGQTPRVLPVRTLWIGVVRDWEMCLEGI